MAAKEPDAKKLKMMVESIEPEIRKVEAEKPPEVESQKPLEVAPKKLEIEEPMMKPEKVESKAGLKVDPLAEVKADLQKAAESNPPGDLRREQLTMRAVEKDKAEEEREQNKERKALEAKTKEAKPKGRPRKNEGDPADQPSKRKRKSKAAAEVDQDEGDAPAPLPKAKAKAKTGAKRTPRSRKENDSMNEPKPNDAMMDEIVQLLVHHAKEPYDKTKDVVHKLYSKGKSKVWTNIYWNRPAGGVKVMEEGKESQKFYFSYAYSSVAVHIYLCNKMVEEWLKHEEAWWQSDEALTFFRELIITAGRAEEIFGKMDK